MANYNKIILMGNLTRDPQLSFLPSQTPVCEFGLAVNRRWRGQNGEQREATCFVDCRLFGKQAETFNQYMNKGKPVLIEGRLEFDQWEGQDGQKRSKHRVFVERFTFVGSRDGGAAPQRQASSGSPIAEPEPPIDEPGDDIPF